MTLPSSYITAVMADSPWGFWGMQETSGTAMADQSGGSHGGNYGSSIVSAAGPYSGWTALTTAPNYAYVPGVINLNTVQAIELWAKRSDANTGSEMLATYEPSSTTTGYELGAHNIGGSGALGTWATNSPSMGWATVGHAMVAQSSWSHVVLQFESDGHWRVYVHWVNGDPATVDDLGAHTLNAVTSPVLTLAARTPNSLPLTGFISAAAFYTHALTSARIDAHFAAAAGPPPGPCQYGTRRKSTITPLEYVTDKVIEDIKTSLAATWVGSPLVALIGEAQSAADICSGLPPPPPTWDPTYLIGNPAYPIALFKSLVWWNWCECVPGTPSPTDPVKPTLTQPTDEPGVEVITVNPTDPCLDLTEVRRMLREILRITQLDYQVDRRLGTTLLPGGSVLGTSHAALTGSGSWSISAALGVQIVVTDRPAGGRELEGAPNYVWDLGWASIMDGNGFIQERRITRDLEVWMPRLMSDAITFGYFLKDGVQATITMLYALP